MSSTPREVDADKGAPLAYAIYVLARNGRPVSGDLRYLRRQARRLHTPLARAQLAGAAALLGTRRGRRAFRAAAEALKGPSPRRIRGPISARPCATAPACWRSARKAPPNPPCSPWPRAWSRAKAPTCNRVSTQEESWLALAAQATAAKRRARRSWSIGAPVDGALQRPVRGLKVACKAGDHRQSRRQADPRRIDVSGRPTAPEPAETHGYSIERGLYHMDGSPADPAHLTQNDVWWRP